MKISLYPNLSKSNAIQIASEVVKLLKLMGGEFVDFESASKKADFVLAIGGDGTILRCVKKTLGTDAKIIGINTGHLGFMSTIEKNELYHLKKIFTGDYTISKRMMLNVKVEGDEVKEYTALNDVLISRKDFKIGRFSVTADKQQVGNYRSDGVLFSTPTGSTAHAFSAGGPIIEPDCKCIEMNLLAPFSLFNRPIIFSENKTLSLTTRDTDIYFTVDGETPIMFEEDATMYITKSEHYANIIAFGEEYFHNTINNKLFSSLK